MTPPMQQRWLMTGFGLLAGASLYLLVEYISQDAMPERLALVLFSFATTFFWGLLGMTGPLRPVQALIGAAGVALVAAGLLGWASLRYDEVEDVLSTPMIAMAGLVVSMLPMPFVISGFGAGWRDYPSLFSHAWGLVVRYSAAWLFVALVWVLLFLSDTLLSLVGIHAIDRLIEEELARWLITGGTLGLGLAVVLDFDAVVSPFLILRLLRLLVPPVLVVMAVFIVALALRGTGVGLFGRLSASATLLAMIAAAVTLVTATVDRTEDEASQSPVLMRAAQGLSLILPVPAGLAVWGIWQRVAEYGWTPERLFLAVIAGLALAYGALYAVAVLRGARWMRHIRQANTTLAIAVIAIAALWLTPALNPEAISARSQIARYTSGRIEAAALDIGAIADWGRPGQAAMARLRLMAEDPARQDLARHLDAAPVGTTTPAADLRPVLVSRMPLQPEGATATRDMVLAGLYDYEIERLADACATPLPDSTAPGCVMVIADFWPDTPGEEALFMGLSRDGYLIAEGYGLVDGTMLRASPVHTDGSAPWGAVEDAGALIRSLQAAPPPLSQAPLNQIRMPDGRGLFLRP